MTRDLHAEIRAFLEQAPFTTGEIAAGIRARYADVHEALHAGPFVVASPPAHANPRATYWQNAAVPSQPLPSRLTHKQKVLQLLSDGEPHTHHELYALGCIAHSRITNLRNDGHVIDCWRDGDLYLYRLVSLDDAALPNPHFGDTCSLDGEVRDGGTASSSEAPASLSLFEDVAA